VREVITRETKKVNSKKDLWYKEIRTMETPRYLRERRKEERMIRVARFRLRNKMREGKYWEEKEKKRCKINVDGRRNRGSMWWKCA